MLSPPQSGRPSKLSFLFSACPVLTFFLDNIQDILCSSLTFMAFSATMQKLLPRAWRKDHTADVAAAEALLRKSGMLVPEKRYSGISGSRLLLVHLGIFTFYTAAM